MIAFIDPEAFEEFWSRDVKIIQFRSRLTDDERIATAQVSEESGQVVMRVVCWYEDRENARGVLGGKHENL